MSDVARPPARAHPPRPAGLKVNLRPRPSSLARRISARRSERQPGAFPFLFFTLSLSLSLALLASRAQSRRCSADSESVQSRWTCVQCRVTARSLSCPLARALARSLNRPEARPLQLDKCSRTRARATRSRLLVRAWRAGSQWRRAAEVLTDGAQASCFKFNTRQWTRKAPT